MSAISVYNKLGRRLYITRKVTPTARSWSSSLEVYKYQLLLITQLTTCIIHQRLCSNTISMIVNIIPTSNHSLLLLPLLLQLLLFGQLD